MRKIEALLTFGTYKINPFFSLRFNPGMSFHGHYLKVGNVIVLFISVSVMYNLIGVKKPSKMIFHYHPMIKNISILGRIRMFPINEAVIVVTFADDLLNLPHGRLLLIQRPLLYPTELTAHKISSKRFGMIRCQWGSYILTSIQRS